MFKVRKAKTMKRKTHKKRKNVQNIVELYLIKNNMTIVKQSVSGYLEMLSRDHVLVKTLVLTQALCRFLCSVCLNKYIVLIKDIKLCEQYKEKIVRCEYHVGSCFEVC